MLTAAARRRIVTRFVERQEGSISVGSEEHGGMLPKLVKVWHLRSRRELPDAAR